MEIIDMSTKRKLKKMVSVSGISIFWSAGQFGIVWNRFGFEN